MGGDKPESVFAPGGNRLVAFVIDFGICILLVVMASLIGASNGPIDPLAAQIGGIAILFLYLAGMPLTPLQATLGKRLCGIKLCDRAGRRLDARRSIVRAAATFAWFWLVGELSSRGAMLGSNFLIALWAAWLFAWGAMTFMPRGESAFDLVAGTLVVRSGAASEAIANAPPRTRPGFVPVATNVFLCLVIGSFLGLSMQTARDRNLRARVEYALEKTAELRGQVQGFHAREKRWPTPSELGVAAYMPYKDGGGYRLEPDGRIVIGFTVMPELKGRTLELRPTADATTGSIAWKCSGDKALRPVYLPGTCRD